MAGEEDDNGGDEAKGNGTPRSLSALPLVVFRALRGELDDDLRALRDLRGYPFVIFVPFVADVLRALRGYGSP
jgi:hypothetical protein